MAAGLGPTVYYQGDGLSRRRKQQRRNELKELFDAFEETVRATLRGEEPDQPAVVTLRTGPTVVDPARGLDRASIDFLEAAAAQHGFKTRTNALRRELDAYTDRLQREWDQDEEDALVMLLS